MNNKFKTVADHLAKMPPDQSVKLIARPHENPVQPEAIDPRSFSSALEYREAMIRNNKERLAAGKQGIVSLATAFGLASTPSSSLNAVTLEGPAQKVLEFLSSADIASATLDTVIHSKNPTPKP